jgi:hypothetical protein
MTRGERLLSGKVATWIHGGEVTPQRLLIPPLRFAPVGMTRREWLLSGKVAMWMTRNSNHLLFDTRIRNRNLEEFLF